MNSIWKIMAYLMSAILVTAPLTACGDDDENDGPDEPTGTAKVLSSISMYGSNLFTLRHNDSGKVTRISSDMMDMTIDIDYSPLTLVVREEDETLTFTDVKVNDSGFITEATLTERTYYDTEESWTTKISYNNAGQITRIIDIDGNTNFSWSNGRLMKVTTSDVDPIVYTYSNLENKAGALSPMWDPLGLYWLSGLFGNGPAYFPSSITADDAQVVLAYKLNSDGTIAAEQVTTDDSPTFTLTYNYISSRSSFVETASKEKFDLPFRLRSPFKHSKK